jgi:hypothetical protein
MKSFSLNIPNKLNRTPQIIMKENNIKEPNKTKKEQNNKTVITRE